MICYFRSFIKLQFLFPSMPEVVQLNSYLVLSLYSFLLRWSPASPWISSSVFIIRSQESFQAPVSLTLAALTAMWVLSLLVSLTYITVFCFFLAANCFYTALRYERKLANDMSAGFSNDHHMCLKLLMLCLLSFLDCGI